MFCIMLSAMNRGRGWQGQFSVKDLDLAQAPKMCPDQSQASKAVNIGQALTAGRKKNDHICFWTIRLQVKFGMYKGSHKLLIAV